MYFNKAILVGNLTQDPELRSLPSGVPTTSFSIATNRVWKDKNGVKQESADFHNIVVFGKQASSVCEFLRKGSSVLVEGRLQTRSWQGQDGKKNYRTEIVSDHIQFGPRPQSEPKEVPVEKVEEKTIDYGNIDGTDIPYPTDYKGAPDFSGGTNPPKVEVDEELKSLQAMAEAEARDF